MEWNDICIADDDEVKYAINYNNSTSISSSETLDFYLPFPKGLYNPVDVIVNI